MCGNLYLIRMATHVHKKNSVFWQLSFCCFPLMYIAVKGEFVRHFKTNEAANVRGFRRNADN